jgi:hypothetical protein
MKPLAEEGWNGAAEKRMSEVHFMSGEIQGLRMAREMVKQRHTYTVNEIARRDFKQIMDNMDAMIKREETRANEMLDDRRVLRHG